MTDLKDLEFSPVKPQLMISYEDGYIKIRWTENLGVRDDRIFDDLQALLAQLTGVEYVKLKRYSASLEIAEHVISEVEAIKLLTKVLGKYFEVLGTNKGRTI